MPMIDLGHRWPSPDMEVAKEAPEPESRVDYPTIYLRERDGTKLPDLPKGEFYVVCKMRVAGFHDPSDGMKSCDLEVHEMSAPLEKDVAMDAVKTTYVEEEEDDEYSFSEEKAKESFRSALKGAIGQGG